MAIDINVEGFKLLCQASKKDLLAWLTEQMTEYYGKDCVYNPGDYLFCIGNLPMMLCAHVDTVFHEQPRDFYYSEITHVISSPQGIGGDDRCGVYSILRILKELGDNKRPFLFFSSDEEVGGASTKRAAIDVKDKIGAVNYLIELDRQGKEDSVYYKCGNRKFKEWIDSFGFIEAHGSFTDICTLCKEWDLAGVNFSVGYTNNHRVSEVVNLDHLAATIEKTIRIINETDPQTLYTFCEEKYPTYGSTSFKDYGGKHGVGSNIPCTPQKGKQVCNTFVTNDILRCKFDTVGFVYFQDSKKKDEKRVRKYIAVPDCKDLLVVGTSGEEVCVMFKDKEPDIYTDTFYIHSSDLYFVRHDIINGSQK